VHHQISPKSQWAQINRRRKGCINNQRHQSCTGTPRNSSHIRNTQIGITRRFNKNKANPIKRHKGKFRMINRLH
jgi:hypothetical protein